MSRVLSRIASTVAVATVAIAILSEPAAALNNGDAVTYTQSIITPASPAANFSGSSGLDTWDVAVDDGKIYGVVHVDPMSNRLRITCNNTSDGSICANYPLTINSYAPANYYPLIYVDPATHYLWTIALNANQNVYAICVDLATRATCETTLLGTTSVDARRLVFQKIVNKKLYGFYFPITGSLNAENVFCYDITTRAVCNSQPYRMSPDSLSDTNMGRIFETGNSTKAILGFAGKLFCFDTTTNAPCSGNWPVDPQWQTVTYRLSEDAAYQTSPESTLGFAVSLPHITDNSVDGTCFTRPVTGIWECLDFTGSAITAPSGLESQFAAAYNLVCVRWGDDNISKCMADSMLGGAVFGSRVYAVTETIRTVPNNATTKIDYYGHVVCFDYATNAACNGFSRELTGMYMPYTTYIDPANPSCVWANGDSGVGQIQNFDAYTGGACGASGSRILMSSFIEPGSTCAPVSYGTLKINSPTNYASAKVTLLDRNGASLGIAQQSFNGSREVDLSSLTLPTASGSQPQMVIELRDGSNNLINSAIDASLSWAGTYNSACVAHGQSATALSVGPTITSAAEVTVEKGMLPVLNNTTDMSSPTWSIDGGADSGKFEITSGGQLKFKSVQPVGDYVVTVKATHGSDTATKTVTVHVVDTTEPEFDLAPSVNVETGTSGTVVTPSNATEFGTYTIGGIDGSLFDINPTTGAISLADPNQAIGDYSINITLTDGSGNFVTHSTVIHVLAHIEVGSPAPATRTNIAGGKTRVNWTAATNAVTYKVKLGNTVLCTTNNTSCVINHRYVNSKHLYVYAIASNNDTKSALAVPQDVVVPSSKVKLGMVHFALDSSFLDIKAVRLLNKYIKAIKTAGYTKIYIYGHTDNQGPAPHDISLSNRRARQVWLYLKKRLPNVTFIRAGYSRNQPAKANTTKNNKAFNRRVEIFGA